jgi:transposase
MALSQDLRKRVVAAVDGGTSRRAAAERFGVSAASAVRWAKRADETGSAAAKPSGGDRRSDRIEQQADFILAAVAASPDITLVELQARLRDERGESFGTTTIWRFFKRRKITVKKSLRTPPSKSGPTS